MKKEFDTETIYNEKFLKTRIKSYRDKTLQTFMMKERLKKALIIFI